MNTRPFKASSNTSANPRGDPHTVTRVYSPKEKGKCDFEIKSNSLSYFGGPPFILACRYPGNEAPWCREQGRPAVLSELVPPTQGAHPLGFSSGPTQAAERHLGAGRPGASEAPLDSRRKPGFEARVPPGFRLPNSSVSARSSLPSTAREGITTGPAPWEHGPGRRNFRTEGFFTPFLRHAPSPRGTGRRKPLALAPLSFMLHSNRDLLSAAIPSPCSTPQALRPGFFLSPLLESPTREHLLPNASYNISRIPEFGRFLDSSSLLWFRQALLRRVIGALQPSYSTTGSPKAPRRADTEKIN